MKNSTRFHNLLLFLLFIVIATLFWVVMTLKDSAQVTTEVEIEITDKPDSITFINQPPTILHIIVRDKGTSLMRSAFMRNPKVQFNFHEFAHDGVFRMTASDIYSILRSKFSSASQISALSIDSIHLQYTDLPPKKVPIDIISQLEPGIGYVVEHLRPNKKIVKVYALSQETLDTIMSVKTRRIKHTGLNKTTTYKVGLLPMRGVRIEPNEITVTATVQPLVTKEITVEITAVNVPHGENISLFPSMATVSFFVPMNRFNSPVTPLTVQVDYNDIQKGNTLRLPVKITQWPSFIIDPKVKPATVEYILVK